MAGRARAATNRFAGTPPRDGAPQPKQDNGGFQVSVFLAMSSATATTDCGAFLTAARKWRGNAFVAFHGSWNRDVPVGYKLSMLDMQTLEETELLTSGKIY